jgi:hypothetical protein
MLILQNGSQHSHDGVIPLFPANILSKQLAKSHDPVPKQMFKQIVIQIGCLFYYALQTENWFPVKIIFSFQAGTL